MQHIQKKNKGINIQQKKPEVKTPGLFKRKKNN